MTEDLKTTSTDSLSKLVDETEATLTSLKAELKRRELAAQHREIDRLDEHMESAQLSLAKIKAFFELMLDELRGEKDKR